MAEYVLKVSLEGTTSMSGLDKYELDERVNTLRAWLPLVDLRVEVDEVQSVLPDGSE